VPSWLLAVIVGLATCQVSLFLTTIYLHRNLAHRAISLAPVPTAIARVLIWISTGIRPRQWAAVHRRHHAYTDVPGDPHSPILEGFWKVQLANAYLYRRYARNPEIVSRYARDIPEDAWDRYLFNHAIVGLSIGIGILVAALGWEWGLVAAGVHAVSYLLLNAAINAVGHSFGRQPYDNTATNNQWLAWLTAGEGLHNNHHAAPTSAKLAFARGEMDPGWWVVRGLEKLRWAKVRLKEPKLLARVARSREPAGVAS